LEAVFEGTIPPSEAKVSTDAWEKYSDVLAAELTNDELQRVGLALEALSWVARWTESEDDSEFRSRFTRNNRELVENALRVLARPARGSIIPRRLPGPRTGSG
jgi:hypothetical protein